jgi:hypothetical protein
MNTGTNNALLEADAASNALRDQEPGQPHAFGSHYRRNEAGTKVSKKFIMI